MQTGGRCGGPFFYALFCTELARNMHAYIIAQTAGKRENTGKGGDPVNKLIARLIDCGMTREVALCMARQYKGRLHDFELYVESVEESSREQMEDV